MPFWRFLGKLPRAKTADDYQAQALEGWSPWQYSSSPYSMIVVPDPEGTGRYRHVKVYVSGPSGSEVTYAMDYWNEAAYFYVPSTPQEEGAFAEVLPQGEGHWRTSPDEESEFPWPVAGAVWPDRPMFLEALAIVEALAQEVVYRGFSPCRLCGCRNGNKAFRFREWEWPAGFRHYIEHHGVRPTADFEALITASANGGETHPARS